MADDEEKQNQMLEEVMDQVEKGNVAVVSVETLLLGPCVYTQV